MTAEWAFGETIHVVLAVADALEALGVSYYVGGSVASSIYGVPRSTQDADVIADMRPDHVAPFIRTLADAFYLPEESIRVAVAQRRSFNVIHLATMFKVDVFLMKTGSYHREAMARRVPTPVSQTDRRTLPLASPEDTVAHKLHWYEQGDRVSERQWKDVLGVLKAKRATLDERALRRAATALRVAPDLVDAALAAAGWPPESDRD